MNKLSQIFATMIILLFARTVVAAPIRVPPLKPVSPVLITHLDRTRRIVALTFDACETKKPAGYDAKIISILESTHTPATLMLGGRWMETHPEATTALGRNPLFEIGNHSYLHPHMTKITEAQMEVELLKTQADQIKYTGKQGVLFRPPYGEYNSLLLITAAKLGLHTITWEVVSGDPDPHVTAKDMIREILRRSRPGSIIIMHMNGRGWHTAEALPAVIVRLHKKGFTFVKVSDELY
jgi:peptidoglycan/xylan/chitin deacetylase (PgdA/CDA1 family)